MPRPKRIVLLNLPVVPELHTPFNSGVCRFINEGNPWKFVVACSSQHGGEQILNQIEWDGAIVRATDPHTCQWLKKTGKPVVNISAWLEDTGLPTMRPDEFEIGAVAARHFMKTGLFRFALIRRRGDGWYQSARCNGFQQTLREAGYSCETYTQKSALNTPEEVTRFSAWIRNLRPSIGIFISDDFNAHNVIQTCQDAGLKVPRDIALIGSTNSPEVLNSDTLTISTVQYDLSHLGYCAAQMLHRMIEGEAPSSRVQLISPDHVLERDSTHAILFDSLDIRRSIEYLQQHYTRSISIESVADHLGMSRSTFYRLFVKEVQQTPHDYLQMLRVQRAQELFLNTSSASLEDVAVSCGFSGRKHLNQAFIKRTSMSVAQWRKQYNTR